MTVCAAWMIVSHQEVFQVCCPAAELYCTAFSIAMCHAKLFFSLDTASESMSLKGLPVILHVYGHDLAAEVRVLMYAEVCCHISQPS